MSGVEITQAFVKCAQSKKIKETHILNAILYAGLLDCGELTSMGLVLLTIF